MKDKVIKSFIEEIPHEIFNTKDVQDLKTCLEDVVCNYTQKNLESLIISLKTCILIPQMTRLISIYFKEYLEDIVYLLNESNLEYETSNSKRKMISNVDVKCKKYNEQERGLTLHTEKFHYVNCPWIENAGNEDLTYEEKVLFCYIQLHPQFPNMKKLATRYFKECEEIFYKSENSTVIYCMSYICNEVDIEFNRLERLWNSSKNEMVYALYLVYSKGLGLTEAQRSILWKLKGIPDYFKQYNLHQNYYLNDYSLRMVSTEGIHLKCLKSYFSKNSVFHPLVPVETLLQNLSKINLGLKANKPLLIIGEKGCGKTSIVKTLAKSNGRLDDLVIFHVGEQNDIKSLLGTYICTDIPGEFEWQQGIITLAVKNGKWLLIENIHQASVETLSILESLIVRNEIYIPMRAETTRAHPDFKLFLSCQSGIQDANQLHHIMPYVQSIHVQAYSSSDISEILSKQFPLLLLIQEKICKLRSHFSISLDAILSYCRRLNLLKYNENLTNVTFFMETIDCFCSHIANMNERKEKTLEIHSLLEMPSSIYEYVESSYDPEISERQIGRAIFDSELHLEHVSNNTYTFTRLSKLLMEKVAVAVQMNDPILLVGETATGKTTTIQKVANMIGQQLIVINMSQQSESSDLLGGYKPISLTHLSNKLLCEFEELFNATFSKSKNTAFISAIYKSLRQQKYGNFLKLIHGAIEKVKAKQLKSCLKASWDIMEIKIAKFEKQLEYMKKHSFFFSFVEGALVKAIREGLWILLDEINLATNETLDILSGLLSNRENSIMLTEKGDKEPIKRHPNFRLFACMNPANDIGKVDLPLSIKDFFFTIYVDEMDLFPNDLSMIIKNYLSPLPQTPELISIVPLILEFYYFCKGHRDLYDGSHFHAHYSMRTLTRALSFALSIFPYYGLVRSIVEGLKVSFVTQVIGASQLILSKKIESTFKVQKLPKCLNYDASKYCLIQDFLIPRGPQEPMEDPRYILTETVKINLRSLARAVQSMRYPVLIQGPTSSGKTSMVEYLANLTGHRFVRINNHEHTDIQEYLGSYINDENGKLVYQEGALVRAVRNGYWIVLDELNLAPTEVLESLNRLLDDNRELYLPETQETIKAHPHFVLFATQNPPGLYGGRKILSRAFRNRFLEMHFDDMPSKEIMTVLHKRCEIPMSHAEKLIRVFDELSKIRKSSHVFMGKSPVTLRDMFRWALRQSITNEELAHIGCMILAERVRVESEKHEIISIIEKVFKVKVDMVSFFSSKLESLVSAPTNLIWTKAMKRVAVLVNECIIHNEPVLLVGETGIGKTSICQFLSKLRNQSLEILNCHHNTETSDFLGSLRPNRNGDSPHFIWQDGPLLKALKDGSFFLLDEISLADDSVLERLNSVLEPARSLLLAEKGSSEIEVITAHKDFSFLATMNPGNDHGKKELSPALRNRFTEIWVPAVKDFEDISLIINSKLDSIEKSVVEKVEKFVKYLLTVSYLKISIRDIVVWCDIIVQLHGKNIPLDPYAIYHGASMLFIDPLNDTNLKSRIKDELLCLCPSMNNEYQWLDTESQVGVPPFVIPKVGFYDHHDYGQYSLKPKTVLSNVMKIFRGLHINKPILLEGPPGVGKTSVVFEIARLCGQRILRVNLSEQTDLMDLFGSDLPLEGGSAGEFEFYDGPLLEAMKNGYWLILDELNLAHQSVLEGLNACLDHRREVFVPELNQTISCHPNFRFFAAQNPAQQGGGRKALPKSFLNRFVRVYIDEFDDDDVIVILSEKFNTSQLPISQMVEFNRILKTAFPQTEFNLRDLYRWCKLLLPFIQMHESNQAAIQFGRMIYSGRLTRSKDVEFMESNLLRVFPCSNYAPSELCLTLDDDCISIGLAKLNRMNEYYCNAVCSDLKIHQSMYPTLESIMHSIAQGWLTILCESSPSLYATNMVKTIGELVNVPVFEFNIYHELDTLELLGGFEQVDAVRYMELLRNELRNLYLKETKLSVLSGSFVSEELVKNYSEALKECDVFKFCHIVGEWIKLLSVPVPESVFKMLQRLQKTGNSRGSFEWVNSQFIESLLAGHFIILRNVNFASPSVLDRLNSLFEPNGFIELTERTNTIDKKIYPNPQARVFMTLDPKMGELSRAMRNRGIEIQVPDLSEIDQSRNLANEQVRSNSFQLQNLIEYYSTLSTGSALLYKTQLRLENEYFNNITFFSKDWNFHCLTSMLACPTESYYRNFYDQINFCELILEKYSVDLSQLNSFGSSLFSDFLGLKKSSCKFQDFFLKTRYNDMLLSSERLEKSSWNRLQKYYKAPQHLKSDFPSYIPSLHQHFAKASGVSFPVFFLLSYILDHSLILSTTELKIIHLKIAKHYGVTDSCVFFKLWKWISSPRFKIIESSTIQSCHQTRIADKEILLNAFASLSHSVESEYLMSVLNNDNWTKETIKETRDVILDDVLLMIEEQCQYQNITEILERGMKSDLKTIYDLEPLRQIQWLNEKLEVSKKEQRLLMSLKISQFQRSTSFYRKMLAMLHDSQILNSLYLNPVSDAYLPILAFSYYWFDDSVSLVDFVRRRNQNITSLDQFSFLTEKRRVDLEVHRLEETIAMVKKVVELPPMDLKLDSLRDLGNAYMNFSLSVVDMFANEEIFDPMAKYEFLDTFYAYALKEHISNFKASFEDYANLVVLNAKGSVDLNHMKESYQNRALKTKSKVSARPKNRDELTLELDVERILSLMKRGPNESTLSTFYQILEQWEKKPYYRDLYHILGYFVNLFCHGMKLFLKSENVKTEFLNLTFQSESSKINLAAMAFHVSGYKNNDQLIAILRELSSADKVIDGTAAIEEETIDRYFEHLDASSFDKVYDILFDRKGDWRSHMLVLADEILKQRILSEDVLPLALVKHKLAKSEKFMEYFEVLTGLNDFIGKLIESFPDYSGLNQIQESINYSLEVPLSKLTLIKIIDNLERVMGDCYLWENVAPRHLSLQSYLEIIGKKIVEFRQRELDEWPKLLEKLNSEMAQEAVETYFYPFFESVLCISKELISKLVSTVTLFIFSGHMGEFYVRLKMLHFMAKLTEENNEISNVLFHMHAYFSLVYGPLIHQAQDLHSKPILKEVLELKQLIKWKDMSYEALKQTSHKSHNQLSKIIKKYKTGYHIQATSAILAKVDFEHMLSIFKYGFKVTGPFENHFKDFSADLEEDLNTYKRETLPKKMKVKLFQDRLQLLTHYGLSDRYTQALQLDVHKFFYDYLKEADCAYDPFIYKLLASYNLLKEFAYTNLSTSVLSTQVLHKAFGLIEHLVYMIITKYASSKSESEPSTINKNADINYHQAAVFLAVNEVIANESDSVKSFLKSGDVESIKIHPLLQEKINAAVSKIDKSNCQNDKEALNKKQGEDALIADCLNDVFDFDSPELKSVITKLLSPSDTPLSKALLEGLSYIAFQLSYHLYFLVTKCDTPDEEEEGQEGDQEGEAKAGTGLSNTEEKGEKNVSNEIENADEIEDLANEQTKKDEATDEGDMDAVEMNNSFDPSNEVEDKKDEDEQESDENEMDDAQGQVEDDKNATDMQDDKEDDGDEKAESTSKNVKSTESICAKPEGEEQENEKPEGNNEKEEDYSNGEYNEPEEKNEDNFADAQDFVMEDKAIDEETNENGEDDDESEVDDQEDAQNENDNDKTDQAPETNENSEQEAAVPEDSQVDNEVEMEEDPNSKEEDGNENGEHAPEPEPEAEDSQDANEELLDENMNDNLNAESALDIIEDEKNQNTLSNNSSQKPSSDAKFGKQLSNEETSKSQKANLDKNNMNPLTQNKSEIDEKWKKIRNSILETSNAEKAPNFEDDNMDYEHAEEDHDLLAMVDHEIQEALDEPLNKENEIASKDEEKNDETMEESNTEEIQSSMKKRDAAIEERTKERGKEEKDEKFKENIMEDDALLEVEIEKTIIPKTKELAVMERRAQLEKTIFEGENQEERWVEYQELVSSLTIEMIEQLGMILEANKSSQLKGDYKTGKRLNMKKIIGYIASDYKKDKIWLRKTKMSKREYQVIVSLDDSLSMQNHPKNVQLAFESLALLSQSLSFLSISFGVCKFGENVELVHSLSETWSRTSGGEMLSRFKFLDKRTNLTELFASLPSIFSSNNYRLNIIISDGLCENNDQLRAMANTLFERDRIITVYILLNAKTVLDMKKVNYDMESGQMKITRYIDTFPFDFYVTLDAIDDLPLVLCDTIRQYLSLVKQD